MFQKFFSYSLLQVLSKCTAFKSKDQSYPVTCMLLGISQSNMYDIRGCPVALLLWELQTFAQIFMAIATCYFSANVAALVVTDGVACDRWSLSLCGSVASRPRRHRDPGRW